MIGARILTAAAALAALAACTQTMPAAPQQASVPATASIAPITVALETRAGRATTMTIWAPAQPRGVVLFSTGYGAWPERYQRAVDVMTSEGFVVLAPLHVDSMRYPERDRFSQQQSLPERFADMHAASAYAAQHYRGLPVIAAGHSYGSLIALGEAGALANLMPARIPEVRAVLAFSTPGRIPGLVTDQSYASIAAPLFEITGTEDTIPAQMGYPSVPGDHLIPAELSPVAAFGLVVDGGGHEMVDDAALMARAIPAIRLFLRGYGLDDAAARRAFAAWRATGADRFIAYEKAS